jgi:hypothetical protein
MQSNRVCRPIARMIFRGYREVLLLLLLQLLQHQHGATTIDLGPSATTSPWLSRMMHTTPFITGVRPLAPFLLLWRVAISTAGADCLLAILQDIDDFDGNLWAFANQPPSVTSILKFSMIRLSKT